MANDLFNDRRKSSPAMAAFQPCADRPAKPDATPVVAREPSGKAARQRTAGIDALGNRRGRSGGLSWMLLGLVAIVLAIGLGAALALFILNESDVATESRSERATSARQSDTKPSGLPFGADASRPTVSQDSPALDALPTPAADNWEELLARGAEHAQARRWPQATADFVLAVRIHPDDHWPWFRAATLLAWQGDRAAYRRHCADMLARFGETNDPMIAERTAKSCLLTPDAVADRKPAVRLAEQAAAATDHRYHAYFLLVRGLAHYREGEFEKAIERAGKAVSGSPTAIGLDTPAHLVVAMSHQRLGQDAEARKSLAQARDIMGQDWFPKLDRGELADGWWHDWLICQTLHREAEELIEGKKGP